MKQLLTAILFLLAANVAPAQHPALDSLLFGAMQRELQRGMALRIPQLSPPFFISYMVQDGEHFQAQASLGAVMHSRLRPQRAFTIRLLTGSFEQTNELYDGAPSEYAGSAAVDGSCVELRRALWLGTDALYKHAAEQLARKQAALLLQNLPEEEEELPDFSQEKVARVEYANAGKMPEQAEWEGVLREASAVFRAYPDISASAVQLEARVSSIYLVSSEGARVKFPLNFCTLSISATLIQPDGKRLYHSREYVAAAAGELPGVAQLKADAEALAGELLAVSRAPKHSEAYSGPVMFEGEALRALLMRRLFEGSQALFALRSSVSGTRPKTLDDKLNKKVLASSLTVKAMPTLARHSGVALAGSYRVDAEAVVPPDSTLLVERGMLRALLNDRIPAKRALHSTGSSCVGVMGKTQASPGVVKVEAGAPVSCDSLKRLLRGMAAAEGLDYAYIVRKLTPGGQPFLLYRVCVNSGEETPVRAAELGALPQSKLKRIAGAAEEVLVENFLLGGVPTSAIMPAAMIVEDVDVDRERESSRTKPPVVENPVKRSAPTSFLFPKKLRTFAPVFTHNAWNSKRYSCPTAFAWCTGR